MFWRRGVNLGGWFSHYVGERSAFASHLENFLTVKDIAAIKERGFDHVRLTLDGNLLQGMDKQVDRAVSMIRDHDLAIQMNMHYGPGMELSPGGVEHPFFRDPKLQETYAQHLEGWIDRYSQQGIAFEFLNEPYCESDQLFNETQSAFVRRFREKTDCPFILTSNAYGYPLTFQQLRPVADKNVFYAFHFYSPFLFTHQKAPWVTWWDVSQSAVYPGYFETEPTLVRGAHEKGDWEKERLALMLEPVREFREKYGARVLCNEFGVYEQAPRASRIHWLRDWLSVLAEEEIPFTYWNYKDCGFGVDQDQELLEVLTAEYE